MIRSIGVAAFALAIAAPVSAGSITHRLQSSVQLSVDAAATQASRIGSNYSIQGNNIKLDTAGGLGSLSAGDAVGYTAADYSIVNAGESFSLTESFIEGDATPTNLTIGSGVAAALPVLGSTTSFAGGVAGSLAGTIDSAGTLTLTAGGAGTQALGQFTSEIQVQN